MTATRTALLGAVLTLIGVWAATHSISSRRPSLASVAARYRPVPSRDRGTHPLRRLSGTLARSGFGHMIERRLGIGLRLADTTVAAVVARMVTITAVSFLTLVLSVGGLITAGVVPGAWWWAPIVLGIPALFGWNVLTDVITIARRRRRALRRVANDFVQLVAVALTTNRSIEEAVEFAANAGTGDGFDLLRDTVRAARPMGIPVWEALAAMADTYGLDDLKGLTGSLGRQAGVGISVAQTVRTEAANMRGRQLAELTDQADRANANLSIPTMGMVIGMVVFLLYPIAQQISDAF